MVGYRNQLGLCILHEFNWTTGVREKGNDLTYDDLMRDDQTYDDLIYDDLIPDDLTYDDLMYDDLICDDLIYDDLM